MVEVLLADILQVAHVSRSRFIQPSIGSCGRCNALYEFNQFRGVTLLGILKLNQNRIQARVLMIIITEYGTVIFFKLFFQRTNKIKVRKFSRLQANIIPGMYKTTILITDMM